MQSEDLNPFENPSKEDSSPFGFAFLDILDRIRGVLPLGQEVYLVGGALRDAFLGRPTHDLDFVLSGGAASLARRVANHLGGAFYYLDEGRETARVLLESQPGLTAILDFAVFRGPDLESDLRLRDFSINAMAIHVDRPLVLIDPLGGAKDLHAKLLRPCSPESLSDDPLRILRGVRLAASYRLHISPEARTYMRLAAPRLPQVSSERIRDELFRILDAPAPATSLRVLDMLGALLHVLPDLEAMKNVHQSPPHVMDVWNHTLAVLQQLEGVLQVLGLSPSTEGAPNWLHGTIAYRIGRYREQIQGHLNGSLNPQRTNRSLLFLAALYHDIAKPVTRTVEENGRTRFFEHDLLGAQAAASRGQALKLSNPEIDRLERIVRHHMRPGLLAQEKSGPTRRAIYRFFRDAGPAGIDICLLSLADVLGVYGPTLPEANWLRCLDVVRQLLEAYWERTDEIVAPPAVLNGYDLMDTFGIRPGPTIGKLLDAVREEQATGEADKEGDGVGSQAT